MCLSSHNSRDILWSWKEMETNNHFPFFYMETKEIKESFVLKVAFIKASSMSQIRKWKCQAFGAG